MPSQPSMAVMMARGEPAAARDLREAEDSELATMQVERLDSSELVDADELVAPDEPGEAGDPGQPAEPGEINDSGIFLRAESAAAAPRPPKRPSLPRVPTATTSASLAALAALSKPAVITMSSNVARKLPLPKPSEISESNPARACPTCVIPLGWVERHQRYYCTQCRAYY